MGFYPKGCRFKSCLRRSVTKCQESVKHKNIYYSFSTRLVLPYSTAIVLFMTNKQLEAQINAHSQMMKIASDYKKGRFTSEELSAQIISVLAEFRTGLAE